MAHRSFYADDLVRLKSGPPQVGHILRTASDVSTHDPHVGRDYIGNIAKGKGIPKPAFKTFMHTGVPPRGTVMVIWERLPWQDKKRPILIKETELELVDRALLVGDVVKKDLASSLSGTVIEISTTVSLVQPSRWPAASSRPVPAGHEDDYTFGNYMPDIKDVVHGISTLDLKRTREFDMEELVLYRNWAGEIVDNYDEVYVRLSNGSVVVVEDGDDLERFRAAEGLAVGDFVRTKKATMRLGRWIYGQYDPSIDPSGFVVDVRTISMEVDWLAGAPSADAAAPEYEIDQDEIQSGQVLGIDRSRAARCHSHTPDMRDVSLNICAGDTVRFKNIAEATAKYNNRQSLPDGSPAGCLHSIPRTESLGYDINVFMIAKTHSTVKVLWQDQSISTLPGIDVVPFLDVAESGDVWPGDLIALKNPPKADQDIVSPSKVGIVQSADAQQRTAKVRWYIDPKVAYTTHSASLLPGAYLGPLSAAIEEVSLYEIETIPGFERRLGDLICFIPPGGLPEWPHLRPELADYIKCLSSCPPASNNGAGAVITPYKDWLGDIVELGLDGLITVRLTCADVVRDVKAPWEGTYLLLSADGEDEDMYPDDIDMDADYPDEDFSMSDGDGASIGLPPNVDEPSAWLDEDDNAVEGQEDWETDEEVESIDEEDEAEPPRNLQLPPQPQPTSPTSPPTITTAASSDPTFSYTTMFSHSTTPPPASFAILDTPPPPNHFFLPPSTTPTPPTPLSGPLLRRIQKEHKLLSHSLPPGIYVRTYSSHLSLLRVLILGPLDTPYALAPFTFDLHLSPSFPTSPPLAHFHSYTDGDGPVNPNLYEDGKICLSLLGTWPGYERVETWDERTSTVLQVLVSILGLVLVEDPYYNEAGYEARLGTVEARIPARLYRERCFLKTRAFIGRAVREGVLGFEEEVKLLFLGKEGGGGPRLLVRALEDALGVMRRSKEGATRDDGDAGDGAEDATRRMSVGALVPLKRQVDGLLDLLIKEDLEAAERLMEKYADVLS